MYLAWPCEIRQEGRRLLGRFPYGAVATLAAEGTVRKERFAPRAFSYTVDGPGRDREVNLLSGHTYAAPIASRGAGSLRLRDSDDALRFEATLPPESQWPTWMRDAVLAVRTGLFAGVSPGFRPPSRSKVPNWTRLVPEPGNSEVQIREILQAVLLELSLVTRPAYAASSVDLRQQETLSDHGLSDDQGSETAGPDGDRRVQGVRLWL